MNFYGSKATEQHTLAGRLIPLAEAMLLAVSKATGQPSAEARYSQILPVWTHNVCDKITATIFKSLVEAAPRDKVVNAHNYGCLIGILLRWVVFYFKEAPEQFKKYGLMDLTPEQEKRLEQVAGLPLLFATASDLFKKPITDGDALIEAGTDRRQKEVEKLKAQFFPMIRFLLNRPIDEQCEFLDGIAKGFKVFLNPAGDFAGDKRRLQIYFRCTTVRDFVATKYRSASSPRLLGRNFAPPPSSCEPEFIPMTVVTGLFQRVQVPQTKARPKLSRTLAPTLA